MGYDLTYQQGCEYAHCPKCNTVLYVYKNGHFITGHQCKFCYNCGYHIADTNNTINKRASWDLPQPQKDDNELHKYCIDITEIIKKKTSVVVIAQDIESAYDIVRQTYIYKNIEFPTKMRDIEYGINTDTASDDNTFNDDKHNENNYQIISPNGDKHLNLILTAVDNALKQYDADNIDVIRNEITNMMDVIWHSENNSFPIFSNVAYYPCIDIKKLETELDTLGIGHVW